MSAATFDSTDSDDIKASMADTDRFARVVNRHFSEIYGYLARRVGRDIADDLSAETFIVAFGSRSRYDASRADALPWLYGIATNLIRRHRRTEVRKLAAYAKSATRIDSDRGDLDDLVTRLDHAESVARVASVFSELDADQRDALYLVAIVGLAYADAAEALQVPVGTVHSRVARARSQLRDLAAYNGQEGSEESIVKQEGQE
jgi:RNA polymerase sigma-70 factor (ECF subfamily)